MNAPVLTTQRLILRPFAQQDAPALLRLLGDEEVNRFLPWYPVKSLKEALAFYREHFASHQALAYAVCLRQQDLPIGYVQVSLEEPHDFGYGLRREFWGQGITTEAARAVLEQLKKAGLPYITATHDRNNPPQRRGDAQTGDALLLFLPGAVAAQGFPGYIPDVPAQSGRPGRPGLPGVLGYFGGAVCGAGPVRPRGRMPFLCFKLLRPLSALGSRRALFCAINIPRRNRGIFIVRWAGSAGAAVPGRCGTYPASCFWS